MKFKKVTALLLAFTLVSSMFAGCGSTDASKSSESQSKESTAKESQEQSSSAEVENDAWKEVSAKVDIPEIIKKDPEHLSWMDTTDPITLDVYYAQQTGEFPGWDTPVEQHITELTGVTVNGTFQADSSGNDLTLMLASGDPLPDIISGMNITSTQYMDLVESDSLWDIRELIEMYCPEMWDTMDPYIRDANLDEDGHLWYLPEQGLSSAAQDYAVSNGWVTVRGDVCEELGVDPDSLTTMEAVEEFVALYMENADKWPEIKYPYIHRGVDRGEGRPFYNSYGGKMNFGEGHLGTDMLYDKDSDSVYWWIEDEKGYDTAKYMWSLVQKGFVTEASFAVGDLYQELQKGSILIACGTNMWYANVGNAALSQSEDLKDAYYQKLPMFSASEDITPVISHSLNSKNCGRGVVITKDCENPERAVKFLQFLDSEYGNLTVTSGVYGVDWVEDVNDFGVNVVKYIGEAETAEGRAARGIYNYQRDWHNINSAYDFVNSYSTGDKIMIELAATDWVFDTYEAAPFTVLNSLPSDSEVLIMKERQREIIKNYLTQMQLAKDEAAFDALYKECIQVLNDNGLDSLKESVLEYTKAYIADMEALGVVFQ